MILLTRRTKQQSITGNHLESICQLAETATQHQYLHMCVDIRRYPTAIGSNARTNKDRDLWSTHPKGDIDEEDGNIREMVLHGIRNSYFRLLMFRSFRFLFLSLGGLRLHRCWWWYHDLKRDGGGWEPGIGREVEKKSANSTHLLLENSRRSDSITILCWRRRESSTDRGQLTWQEPPYLRFPIRSNPTALPQERKQKGEGVGNRWSVCGHINTWVRDQEVLILLSIQIYYLVFREGNQIFSWEGRRRWLFGCCLWGKIGSSSHWMRKWLGEYLFL